MDRDFDAYLKLDCKKFSNQYVVILNGKVVASGQEIDLILAKIRKKYPRKIPLIAKVPSPETLILKVAIR